MLNSRHPGPRRVCKWGSQWQLMTPDLHLPPIPAHACRSRPHLSYIPSSMLRNLIFACLFLIHFEHVPQSTSKKDWLTNKTWPQNELQGTQIGFKLIPKGAKIIPKGTKLLNADEVVFFRYFSAPWAYFLHSWSCFWAHFGCHFGGRSK